MTNDIEIIDYNDLIKLLPESHIIGLSIKIDKKEMCIEHVGLAFRTEEKFLIIDYVPDRVREKDFNESYLLIPIELEEDDFITILGHFRSIKEINGHINFSFSLDSSSFDKTNGKFLPTNDDSGLTCCTFVSTGLECAGYPIILKETWNVRQEDRDIQDDYMREFSNGYSENNRIIYPRIRPEELSLACSMYNYEPLSFDQINDNIHLINNKIKSIIEARSR